jgi:hypothetical protein
MRKEGHCSCLQVTTGTPIIRRYPWREPGSPQWFAARSATRANCFPLTASKLKNLRVESS